MSKVFVHSQLGWSISSLTHHTYLSGKWIFLITHNNYHQYLNATNAHNFELSETRPKPRKLFRYIAPDNATNTWVNSKNSTFPNKPIYQSSTVTNGRDHQTNSHIQKPLKTSVSTHPPEHNWDILHERMWLRANIKLYRLGTRTEL